MFSMLQINSKKFFKTDSEVRSKTWRAVFHTNYELPSFLTIKTPAGDLQGVLDQGGTRMVVFSFEQYYEAELSSNGEYTIPRWGLPGPGPLVADMAAVLSFVWEATFTTDQQQAHRLLHQTQGLTRWSHPSDHLKRHFDPVVLFENDKDPKKLEAFLDALFGLKRSTYRVVMSSIRRFVSALHLMADDRSLAYVMIIAALESLAQEFTVNPKSWDYYPDSTRKKLDPILTELPEEQAQAIREILLEAEHQRLQFRFVNFIEQHITGSYYREEAREQNNPVPEHRLNALVNRLYVSRSKYVHKLEGLPQQVTALGAKHHPEWVKFPDQEEGEVHMLTFEGLARLFKHVVQTFIDQQPKFTSETYNYQQDDPGVMHVFAPGYMWLGDIEEPNKTDWNERVTELLKLLDLSESGQPQPLPNMKPLMSLIEKNLSGIPQKMRVSAYLFYAIYHFKTPPALHLREHEKFLSRNENLLGHSTLARWIYEALKPTLSTYEFDADKLDQAGESHLRDLKKNRGIHMPQYATSQFFKHLASLQQHTHPERALFWVKQAIMSQPGDGKLMYLEKELRRDPAFPILEDFELPLVDDSDSDPQLSPSQEEPADSTSED